MAQLQYALVIDNEGKILDPTKVKKAWYLIRKGRVKLVEEYPLIIQLKKKIPKEEVNNDKIVLGIDDGYDKVGFALIQKCQSKNKVLFKATMKQRQEVSKLMTQRREYRRYRRQHKRYRAKRFDNRSSSKRKGRIAPSIKQKKQAILRVVNYLNKFIRIDKIVLEDVAIDIRKAVEGKELYSWEYQESNRLDENLRKATLYRDDCAFQICGATDTMLEAHHIIPQRDSGADSIYNLITLCKDCHKDKVDGSEYKYKDEFLNIIDGKELNIKPAMHVMQGKTWLREKLSKIVNLEITTGGDTANKRIDYDIKKSHSNDSICITNLLPVDNLDVKEYFIKPLRKKSKAKIKELKGFKHRDIVRYTKRNGETYDGYITSLRIKNNKYKSKVCNFTTLNGEKTFRGYGLTNLTLINRPKGLMII
ncbi:restriction endonuclease [Halobacteroides halobius DSM 5150]|uniref:Restriction endonuclease n=1 Tax=Halobacteroides halobius (strain ATCC 35273 / DSM 5150 / MD-1) TaxID=748449 RepID=L0KBA4_HALHC|nr:RNA-guided endonuclease IscB [Halobacteroides halobius]AGB41805.1 restriction endonuclease [Halobacteroides halobius DSM 5150]